MVIVVGLVGVIPAFSRVMGLFSKVYGVEIQSNDTASSFPSSMFGFVG